MNTEVNTDNVALTQRLSSKTTKNYYTGGTFPAIPYDHTQNLVAIYRSLDHPLDYKINH